MLAGYPQILVHGQRSDADVNAVDVADDVQEKQIRRSSVLNLLDRPGFDRMSRFDFSRDRGGPHLIRGRGLPARYQPSRMGRRPFNCGLVLALQSL